MKPNSAQSVAAAVSLILLTCVATATRAQQVQVGAETDLDEVVVTAEKSTRSTVALTEEALQDLLPGINPLKAIQTLPGVIFETADPWGNNEQNQSLIIHGFSTQQLGYTLDGVPLGDQQYGNYNGLSVSRAVTSENVARVELASGAGSVGVASTSNLGGAIETFSSDPRREFGADVRHTLGSYDTGRTFVRIDSGDFGGGNSAYVSYLHHDARAWDFDGHQGGDQLNAKFVHEDDMGKFTAYLDLQKKVEPNEDATAFGNQQTTAAAGFTPYTRPFLYPNYAAGMAYLSATGAPPAIYGNNFSNYFSAAQRKDALGYVNYDWKIAPDMTWSNQAYYHANIGRGIVAGPVNQAGLPGLFAIYFPGQNLVQTFGGTGYEVRTTEYGIHRGGLRSTLAWQRGDNNIQAGVWYEHDSASQGRRWYPFSVANNDLTPYDRPVNAAFTQYLFESTTKILQPHLQDQWQVLPTLLLQAGWKASLQTADGDFPVNQRNLPTTNPQVHYPSGKITSNEWFLPQFGAVWDLTSSEHLFFNVQKNLRQFLVYGAGGASPWSQASQQAFEDFKDGVKPESAWTYEAGLRTKRVLDGGFLTGIDGQINYYHVKFSDRLLNVSTFSFINPNPSYLVNVGGVKTDGADLAVTLHFGRHLQFYNGVSYNDSKYDSDYSTQAANGAITVVPLSGKQVPLTSKWLYKSILSGNVGNFEAQITGDYVGKRPVTYFNDLSVDSKFLLGLQASYTFDQAFSALIEEFKVAANVTNLTDKKGVSTANVTGNSGGYGAFPLPPRMVFVTLSAKLR